MKDYKQLKETTKNKYDVDRVYSYSQVKTFEDDPYEYYLKYVVYQKPDIETQSIYGVLGGIVHDILEKFYKNEIKREDCQKVFESSFRESMLNPNVSNFSNDKELNISQATKFQLDIVNYFKRMIKLEGKVMCEEPFSVLLEDSLSKAAFIGYIDFINFDKDEVKIIDYKTSTMYKDSQIKSYSQQLLLYAYAVHQRFGIPYDKMTVGWNFLKYAKVVSKRDLSEEIIERSKIFDYPDEDYLITDCYVTIRLSEEMINEFIEDTLVKVRDIEDKIKVYELTHDDSIFNYTLTEDKLFRINNFCQYSEKYHRPLREYLEKCKQNVV